MQLATLDEGRRFHLAALPHKKGRLLRLGLGSAVVRYDGERAMQEITVARDHRGSPLDAPKRISIPRYMGAVTVSLNTEIEPEEELPEGAPGARGPREARGPRVTVSAEVAQAAWARITARQSTLIQESRALGFTHNGHLRAALRLLLGREAFAEAMRATRKKPAKAAPEAKPAKQAKGKGKAKVVKKAKGKGTKKAKVVRRKK